MGKCPLCGSDGDDLVFRFYCSNGSCRNYVPSKRQAVPTGNHTVKCGSCGGLVGNLHYKGPFPGACPLCCAATHRNNLPWWYDVGGER